MQWYNKWLWKLDKLDFKHVAEMGDGDTKNSPGTGQSWYENAIVGSPYAQWSKEAYLGGGY